MVLYVVKHLVSQKMGYRNEGFYLNYYVIKQIIALFSKAVANHCEIYLYCISQLQNGEDPNADTRWPV